jgi:hypothetical protein
MILTSLHSTLWVTGKSITFLIPLVIIVFAFFLIDLKKINSSFFRYFVILFVYSWILSQLVFGFTRVQGVYTSGVPHSYPPYISIQDITLKSKQNWILKKDLIQQASCDVYEIDIDQPFQRHYIQMYLTEMNVKWFDKNLLNSYFGNGNNIGYMPSISGDQRCLFKNVLVQKKDKMFFTLYLSNQT